MNNKKKRPPYDPDYKLEAEYRLGQCLIAFGAGAGPIRVRREAVREFLGILRPSFETQANDYPCGWLDSSDYVKGVHDLTAYKNHASQITDMSRAVGRLAADLATREGYFSIRALDVEIAFVTVQQHYKVPAPDEDLTRGYYCTDGGRPRGVTKTKPRTKAKQR